MILLTTPDYFPKLGGLSSHTKNVEKVLTSLGLEYELFHWKNYREVVGFDKARLAKFSFIINIHSGFHMFMPETSVPVINFVNGAEILFYSDNVLKRFVKNLTRRKSLRRMESAFANIFISNFTFQTLQKKGLMADFSRDLIHHMAVDVAHHKFHEKKWDQNPLTFICVARDVPHKNFAGVISFCETVKKISGRDVELITVTNKEFTSDVIKITPAINPDNTKRDELLKSAHINLLLSLDHSHRGFFEGFGQIVQEAAMFGTPSLVLGTGGLPESVHDKETGWVLKDTSEKNIREWLDGMNATTYARISKKSYTHTISSHGLEGWKKLFGSLLGKS